MIKFIIASRKGRSLKDWDCNMFVLFLICRRFVGDRRMNTWMYGEIQGEVTRKRVRWCRRLVVPLETFFIIVKSSEDNEDMET